jgi:putative transposase
VACGLHRVERLMRQQALRARPKRRRLPTDHGERAPAAIAQIALDEYDMFLEKVRPAKAT